MNYFKFIIQVMILALFLLSIVSAYDQQPKIIVKQKTYSFVPTIPADYSITANIQQQINPIKKKSLNSTPNKQGPTFSQMTTKFVGLVQEAKTIITPLLRDVKKPQPVAINQNSHQNIDKDIERVKDTRNILFEQKIKVQMNGQRTFDLIKIEEERVINEQGQIKKITTRKLPMPAHIGSLIQDQDQDQDQAQVQAQPNTKQQEQQKNDPVEQLLTKIISPINKSIRSEQQPLTPLTQAQKQQRRQIKEENIIKIIFSALLTVSIILIIFGYRPHRKQAALAVKDDEESALK